MSNPNGLLSQGCQTSFEKKSQTMSKKSQTGQKKPHWVSSSVSPTIPTILTTRRSLPLSASRRTEKCFHRNSALKPKGSLVDEHCILGQCFSTFFASRTTLCNKKILGNTKQSFIITIMMFSSVLALLIY